MRHGGSPAVLEHRRLLAVRRVLEGESTIDVADFLEVEPRSVRRWVQTVREQGWEGLISHPVPGRPRKLSPTQEKIVLRWLQDCPTQFGFATELWTCQRLAQLIREEWGIRISPRYLPQWLRQRDFTPQRPQLVPRERNPDEIARWLKTEWPRIKKETLRKMAYLVLLDESGLLMAPLVKRTWALRGQRPELRHKGQHREKVSLAAALWLSPRRHRLGLIYQTLINDYFNNEQVAQFLEVLLREIPHPLVVLWDRGNMHKGDPIRDELKRFQPRLSVEQLPPWAPMLDPVEPIFGWLKYGRLPNFAPIDAHDLNEVVLAELYAIREDQECLRNFWHASELPLPKPLKKRTLLF